jgi:hypothetical protein
MKDDKKKVIVVGVLVVALAGVGAFTMLGGSSPAPAPTATASKDASSDKDKKDAAAEDVEGPKNPLYAADLAQRDPFQPRAIPVDPAVAAAQKAAAPTLPTPPKSRRSARVGGGGYTSIPPVQISGSLPEGPIGLTPTGPDPSTFNYSVSGVIVGQRPAAVFTDSQGNQRLVPVGGSLDGDSKVVSIDKGQVTVEHRGKKLRLPLGGNPK